jgi:ribosomal protein L11 methyltransferase
MAWLELRWGIPRLLCERVSQLLFEEGTLGIQEDFLPGEAPPPRQPWDSEPRPPSSEFMLLKAWWNIADQESAFLAIQELHRFYPDCHSPQWIAVAEEDWGEDWKRNFHRHQINDRLAVSPPWVAKKGDLIIEPGIAFGTGEHPTTYSCLEAIALWAVPGWQCLDVGCGSGILALAAAKLGMEARGVDVEEQAILSAQENAVVNGLTVSFDQTDIALIKETYDVVVANLYAEVLVALACDIVDCCKDKLALAGILTSKEQMVRTAYQELTLLRRKVDGEWVSLWFER